MVIDTEHVYAHSYILSMHMSIRMGMHMHMSTHMWTHIHAGRAANGDGRRGDAGGDGPHAECTEGDHSDERRSWV